MMWQQNICHHASLSSILAQNTVLSMMHIDEWHIDEIQSNGALYRRLSPISSISCIIYVEDIDNVFCYSKSVGTHADRTWLMRHLWMISPFVHMSLQDVKRAFIVTEPNQLAFNVATPF